jgi:hypothetical protein
MKKQLALLVFIKRSVLTSLASFAVLASSSLSLALADAGTNGTYLKVLQASNNIQDIIQTLPAVEKLWPQEPEAYLKSVNQASQVLRGDLDNPDTKQAFSNLFTSMMRKSCPTNEGQAIFWIELKRDIISNGLNFDEIRNNKSQGIDVAKFIGEIRSRIILNYSNQGGMLSISMPGHPEIIKQMVDENERKKITDKFQSALRETDQMLVSFLQDYSSRFPSSNPTNAAFIKKISDAAHLTGEERKKL